MCCRLPPRVVISSRARAPWGLTTHSPPSPIQRRTPRVSQQPLSGCRRRVQSRAHPQPPGPLSTARSCFPATMVVIGGVSSPRRLLMSSPSLPESHRPRVRAARPTQRNDKKARRSATIRSNPCGMSAAAARACSAAGGAPYTAFSASSITLRSFPSYLSRSSRTSPARACDLTALRRISSSCKAKGHPHQDEPRVSRGQEKAAPLLHRGPEPASAAHPRCFGLAASGAHPLNVELGRLEQRRQVLFAASQFFHESHFLFENGLETQLRAEVKQSDV